MVVPALAVVGWAAYGPRPRITRRVVALALVWPVGWLAWTLVVGALVGWYPYPFLDPREDGAGAVAVASVAITAVFVVFFALAAQVEARARPAPRAD